MMDREENRAQLQDLYTLDQSGRRGDLALIYYAQFRALDYTHAEAMDMCRAKLGIKPKTD